MTGPRGRRAPGTWRPCRRLRPPRRPASARAAGRRPLPGRGRARCALRDDERDRGKRNAGMLEERRAHVPFEVVDGDHRDRELPRHRLRRANADEQRADEAGAAGRQRSRRGPENRVPDRSSASVTTGPMHSRWRREASSGTTPPYFAWMSSLRGDDRREHVAAILDDASQLSRRMTSRWRESWPWRLRDRWSARERVRRRELARFRAR